MVRRFASRCFGGCDKGRSLTTECVTPLYRGGYEHAGVFVYVQSACAIVLTRGLRVVRYGLVESCLRIAHCERAKASLLAERAPVKMACGMLLSNMEL